MPIQLRAFDTPNGRKISVALEEMALPGKGRIVDIRKGDQHDPAFLEISPNGKVPAIVDAEWTVATGSSATPRKPGGSTA